MYNNSLLLINAGCNIFISNSSNVIIKNGGFVIKFNNMNIILAGFLGSVIWPNVLKMV